MNDGHGAFASAATTAMSTKGAYPPLAEQPEIIKFVRLDAAHYHAAYQPETYDPLHARQVLDETIEEAVEAEALGWDGFFFTEHHFDAFSLVPSPNILLAALAVRTERMRLGTGVHIFPVRDPIRFAEEAGMLDVLSGGRLEFGIGRGNYQFELNRFTAPIEESVARFDENLDVFTKAIHADSFTYDGQWTKVRKPSTIYPRPLQKSLPIWVAAGSPGTVEKVGRLGHNLAGGAFADGGERLERYVEASRKAGRAVSGANFAAVVAMVVAPTDAEAEKSAAQGIECMRAFGLRRIARDSIEPGKATSFPEELLLNNAVFGSPRTVRDKLAHILAGCGARRLLVVARLAGMSTEVTRQTQRLLAETVMPELRTFKAGA
jgi:alkanesulfonate monooxygenase SsuD/methylene tetrahydromethanopterin reductase-like flavin-dependent oxidoreductase (luciferase family)